LLRGRVLLGGRVTGELVDFADFDSMPAVPFEHFARCLHVLANERFSASCPVSGMDSVTGTYTVPFSLSIPIGEPDFAHIVMHSLL